MKNPLKIVAISLLIAGTLYSCKSNNAEVPNPTTTFIIVRHAEKADDGTADPPLNEAGKRRAHALANHLKETRITAVYSTPYKRTRQTVEPIANVKNLDINLYDPSDSAILDSILKTETNGTILISGHSNTTPELVNQLTGKDEYTQLDENDYGNLFIVTASEKGNGTAIRLTFGNLE